MCGTWGQAATMPTMPASAFCGRIPKGIQLIKGGNCGILGPSRPTCIPERFHNPFTPKTSRTLSLPAASDQRQENPLLHTESWMLCSRNSISERERDGCMDEYFIDHPGIPQGTFPRQLKIFQDILHFSLIFHEFFRQPELGNTHIGSTILILKELKDPDLPRL